LNKKNKDNNVAKAKYMYVLCIMQYKYETINKF
jgi:hypothetical protein